MTFFKECPVYDLSLTSICESPMEMHFPEYFQEKISHCSLQSAWLDISPSDWLLPH
jgi:hypothetical protein